VASALAFAPTNLAAETDNIVLIIYSMELEGNRIFFIKLFDNMIFKKEAFFPVPDVTKFLFNMILKEKIKLTRV